jgi:hypothetical protein
MQPDGTLMLTCGQPPCVLQQLSERMLQTADPRFQELR